MGNGAKKPGAKWPAVRDKQPRGASLGPNVSIMQFKWRSNRLDWDGPWSWREMEIIHALADIVPKLHDFESMTWAEIEGNTGSHFVKCTDICKEAQDRLTAMDEDAEQLFSLRLTGKIRLWGIRDVAILRLIWWDPEHTVCPALKKHT